MNEKHIKRLMKAKRRAGLKYYPHGFELVVPVGEDWKKIRFSGNFDRRQLRRMIRKTFVQSMTVEQIDFLIDNFGTRLRPATGEEFNAMLKAVEAGDAED